LVLSVGGGTDTVSRNLVKAMEFAKLRKAWVVSIVSRDGGAALKMSDACILVPVVVDERITPHAEGWQSVICHLLVNAMEAE
jgi:D-sedoheptulose 7-phosphate isomerase